MHSKAYCSLIDKKCTYECKGTKINKEYSFKTFENCILRALNEQGRLKLAKINRT